MALSIDLDAHVSDFNPVPDRSQQAQPRLSISLSAVAALPSVEHQNSSMAEAAVATEFFLLSYHL